MYKALVGLFGFMGIVAVVYCNYHAVRESKPFVTRMWSKLMDTRIVKFSGRQINRVTGSKIVTSTTGRITHIFSKKNADRQAV